MDFNTLWLAVEQLRTEPAFTWRDVLNRIAANIKWVVKAEEFEKFTRNLETAKHTLILAMLLAGMEIAFQLKQSEYRFLKRIDILSGAVADVHGQNSLRVTELYDSITPNEPLQTDHLLTMQSVDRDVTFAVSTSGTPQIGLVEFSFENQQGDIANQAKTQDIETLEAARRWMEYFELIKEALREMHYALETCTREYELYPEAKLKIVIMELYTESFSGMTRVLKVLREKSKVWIPGRNTQRLKDSIAKIWRSSRKVITEVEYLHRRELRQAHLRLRGIDRKQDQVIRALDEQKKILISMQEEQKALNLINDHQKVVQMLQQLLAKFPPPAAAGASMSE
ncbi:hypothetical protein THAR02_04751 [Trichoderma harzianum]|uniref:Uncharacterized protein n=1 Tax=Trichoderma harzianum TaxID=5544 RepID=A0A0G0ADR8_TRIHA|nr:hypothetical protein THAR02_04751 [Trichoderma harzianum]